MGKKTHILVLPLPLQGHVNPLMHFSRLVSDHGIKVTFVNTEVNHRRIVNAMSSNGTNTSVSLASVSDGLENDGERNDFGKLFESMLATMPQKLKELIGELNGTDDGIACIVADVQMAWVREIAVEFGLEVALFFPGSAAFFTLELNVFRLINDGLIDSNGFPTGGTDVIHLSSSMPLIDKKLPWIVGDEELVKSIFKYLKKTVKETELIEWKLVNSTAELEPAAFKLSPNLIPIGPLIANYETASSGAQFWREDSTYLTWLDQQQPNSVIYVSFGSITIFNRTQIEELATGLELTNKPFLWVLRAGMADGTTLHDVECINGKVVNWVSQQRVLEHPAIACFVTHCGWNSTIEGVTHGVPFLCWPYFADQFSNRDYICEVWKVGLELQKDESEVVTKEEVKQKVEKLVCDEAIKARSLKLKDLVRESIAEDGQSSRNLTAFINWLKK